MTTPSDRPDGPGGLPASDDVLVSGRERAPRRPGTRLTAGSGALVVGVLALAAGLAVAALSSGPPRGGGALPSTAAPSRTADAPTTPPSTDLTTVVSVGRVSIPGTAVDAQVSQVAQELRGSGVVASYRSVPAPAAEGPPGVQVEFDRRLDPASAAAFRAALDGLPGAAVELRDVPGTTVDVSVPAAAGYTCVPDFFRPQVVLDGPDLDLVARELWAFGLGFGAGRVTASYTGPQLPTADLRAVGAALAHSCGASPAAVTLLRHRDTG